MSTTTTGEHVSDMSDIEDQPPDQNHRPDDGRAPHDGAEQNPGGETGGDNAERVEMLRAGLAELEPHRGKQIRFVADQLGISETKTVGTVLERYGIITERSYRHRVLRAYRAEHGIPDTSQLPRMTDELLAELEAMNNNGNTTTATAEATATPEATPEVVAGPQATGHTGEVATDGEPQAAPGNTPQSAGNSVASASNTVAPAGNDVASDGNSVASGGNTVSSGGNDVASGSNGVVPGVATLGATADQATGHSGEVALVADDEEVVAELVAETDDVATDADAAAAALARQENPVFLAVWSEEEKRAERELAEKIRASERDQRWKTAQAQAAAADAERRQDEAETARDRKTTAAIRRQDARDAVAARKALAAQRRATSPHAQLASLYRHRTVSLTVLGGVVAAGMLWSAVNVQHNIAPGGATDPLYWFSYLIEAMISSILVIIMIGTNKVAEWGITDNKRMVAAAEAALLALTLGLNTFPSIRASHWYDTFTHAVAPVMIGVALLVHHAASTRYGKAIALAVDAVAEAPPVAMPRWQATREDTGHTATSNTGGHMATGRIEGHRQQAIE